MRSVASCKTADSGAETRNAKITAIAVKKPTLLNPSSRKIIDEASNFVKKDNSKSFRWLSGYDRTVMISQPACLKSLKFQ